MPYSVEHLIQNQNEIITVPPDKTILETLDLMIVHDFSQLPIIDSVGRLIGMGCAGDQQ